MNSIPISRYGNLASLSQKDWHNLDIHLFIAANYSRYCALLLKKVGRYYLPGDVTDSLAGIFYDVAWKPLKTVHERYLDAEGERRNQIMLGTLKKIAVTRMVDALIREFPNHLGMGQLAELAESDEATEDEEVLPYLSHACEPMAEILLAAEDTLQINAPEGQDTTDRTRSLLIMLERVRPHLTPIQFRHLSYVIRDRLDVTEIAERTGHSVTNARTVLLAARRRLLTLVPATLAGSVEDCVRLR